MAPSSPLEVGYVLTVGRATPVRTPGRRTSDLVNVIEERRDDSRGGHTMPRDMTNPVTEDREPAVESERGALVAVLLMVILGVAGIFAVS
ncbi:hypothetical protein AB0C42_21675 [Micromonospora taraxaci]|nr:hypothetical protein [Micromonospora taraxaci]